MAVCALPPAAVGQEPGQPFGIVSEIAGTWRRSHNNEPLFRGDVIGTNETVRPEGSNGTLAVFMLESGRVWRKACTAVEPCRGTYRPIPRAEPTGFWAFLSQYWTSDRTLSPVFARARSAGDGPVHGLAVVEGDATDLTQVLRQLTPGQYRAALAPAPGAREGNTTASYDITITVPPERPVHVERIQPGLYSLTIADARQQAVGSAVVVFVSPRAPALEAWLQANERVDRLGLAAPTQAALRARILYALHGGSADGR